MAGINGHPRLPIHPPIRSIGGMSSRPSASSRKSTGRTRDYEEDRTSGHSDTDGGDGDPSNHDAPDSNPEPPRVKEQDSEILRRFLDQRQEAPTTVSQEVGEALRTAQDRAETERSPFITKGSRQREQIAETLFRTMESSRISAARGHSPTASHTPKTYASPRERMEAERAFAERRREAFLNQLNDKQQALLPLLSRLPKDFPARDWDTMHPKKQLAIMQKTDLSREEQWQFLNAAPSVRTLMDVWKLQENGPAQGLTDTQLNHLTERLLSIGNERLGTQTHQIQFANERMRNSYLRYLDEKEEEAFGEVLGPASRANTVQPDKTPRPENTPLPQPSRAYVREWSPKQTQLFGELKQKVKGDLNVIERVKGWNTTREAIQKVFDYEDVIHEMADKYDVPAEYIETIMFREQRFYDFFDDIGDKAVAKDKRDDSSTGIMQVFGETAIEALNFAVGKGFDSYSELLRLENCTYLDPENRGNRMLVWERMRNDVAFCIEVATSYILACADEMAPGKTFENFTAEDAINTLSRYNGTNENARNYGEECYHWLSSFADYERDGDRHEAY